jgi:hypothetical protein
MGFLELDVWLDLVLLLTLCVYLDKDCVPGAGQKKKITTEKKKKKDKR